MAEKPKTLRSIFKGSGMCYKASQTELPFGIFFLENTDGSNDVIIDNIYLCKKKPAGEALYFFIMGAKVFGHKVHTAGLKALVDLQ